MSKYSVGLQNAGSYLVSGRPFVARQSVGSGQEVAVTFPFVTKNVIIRIPQAPNSARNTVMPAGGAAIFLSPSLHAKGSGKIFDGSGFGGAGKDFAISWWLRTLDPTSGNLITYFQSGSDNNVAQANPFQLSFDSSGIKVAGTNSGLSTFTNTAHNPKDGNWHHMLLTQNTGSLYLYINGNSGGVSSAGNITNVNTFRFGWNGGGGNDSLVWDETTAFNTGFDQDDVTEIYNSSEFFNPRYHAKSSNLAAWWTMGDTSGDRPVPINGLDHAGDYDYDVVVNRFDSVATGAPRNLTAVFNSVAGDWVKGATGPFTSQTTGKLRVHMLSTGSSPHGANIIPNKHYRELQGYDTVITLPMKTKELYFTGVGAQVTFEVIAELTNIPNGRMYALTGSGIDE